MKKLRRRLFKIYCQKLCKGTFTKKKKKNTEMISRAVNELKEEITEIFLNFPRFSNKRSSLNCSRKFNSINSIVATFREEKEVLFTFIKCVNKLLKLPPSPSTTITINVPDECLAVSHSLTMLTKFEVDI